jgi:hypothetical protein
MTIDLVTVIIGGLASTVSFLAGIIYWGKVREIRELKKENKGYKAIILSEVSKKDETLREFARVLVERDEGGTEGDS